MKHLHYFHFQRLLLLCGCVVEIQTFCPHPDVPFDGSFTPQQEAFELGDKITYSCKKGFALSGKDRRTCKSSGVWSDHTPFCDYSVPLSQPITSADLFSSSLSEVIDGNSSTCFEWHNATGGHLYLHLDKKAVIVIVKLFLKKGITKIKIMTGLNNNMELCEDYDNFVETDRWIRINCKSNVLADTMKILIIQSRFISFCEIEVYGKEEDSCKHPPIETTLNGHFEVSRSKATLICDEGYKSKRNRLVCEGKGSWTGRGLRCDQILCNPVPSDVQSGVDWTYLKAPKKLSAGTMSELKCMNGYHKIGDPDIVVCQKNGTWTKTNATCVGDGKPKTNTRTIIFVSTGIIIVLLTIASLATTIHFFRKQRNKEIVVVYQSQPDGSVPHSESEYSSSYKPLKTRPPEPPSTGRPMAKLSTLSRGGNKAPEYWKNTLEDQNVPPILTFDTMKS